MKFNISIATYSSPNASVSLLAHAFCLSASLYYALSFYRCLVIVIVVMLNIATWKTECLLPLPLVNAQFSFAVLSAIFPAYRVRFYFRISHVFGECVSFFLLNHFQLGSREKSRESNTRKETRVRGEGKKTRITRV